MIQPTEFRDLQGAFERLCAYVCKRLGHDWGETHRLGHPERVGEFYEVKGCRNCGRSSRIEAETTFRLCTTAPKVCPGHPTSAPEAAKDGAP